MGKPELIGRQQPTRGRNAKQAFLQVIQLTNSNRPVGVVGKGLHVVVEYPEDDEDGEAQDEAPRDFGSVVAPNEKPDQD